MVIFFFIFFILECYCRFNNRKRISTKYVFVIPMVVIFLGGFVYQQVYVIKNHIRGNLAIMDISYLEGVQHLSTRLSMNSMSLGAYQNVDRIVDLYRAESLSLKESKALLRPVLPGQLMDKNFRSLNNNIVQSYTPTITASTSSDFGIVMYYWVLGNASMYDAILSLILTLVFIVLAKIYFDTMCNGSGKFDFLFFLILFKFTYTVSLENVIGQGFVPYLYLTFVVLIFGGVKFVKGRG